MKLPITQSMDMLLGVASPQQPNAINQPGTPVDGALFGDLLGMLMALQPMVQQATLTDPTQVSGDPLLDGLNLFANPDSDPKSLLFAIGNQNLLSPELFGQTGLPQTVNTDEGMLLTSISETDSAVTLTLTPVADQDKPILLTISKEAFTNIIQQLQNGETPNADAKQAFSPAMLQALLTKLNTKEITITDAPSPFAEHSLLMPNVQGNPKANLTDKNSTAVQLLKELPASLTSVSIVAADELVAADTKTAPQLISANILKPTAPQMTGIIATQPEETQLPVTAVAQKEIDKPLLFEKDSITGTDDLLNTPSTDTAKGAVKADQFSTILTSSGTPQVSIDAKTGEVVARPAIQLPENIHDLLKPYGKSVTLKIEPEHLGTATISLNMQQGVLRARVVVESNAAKTMVENSLGQLVSQLAKSNITVDSVNVQVGGQTLTEHEFARQQQRQHRPYRMNNTGRFAEEKKLAAVTAQTSAISRYAFRAVPGGLNLVV